MTIYVDEICLGLMIFDFVLVLVGRCLRVCLTYRLTKTIYCCADYDQLLYAGNYKLPECIMVEGQVTG